MTVGHRIGRLLAAVVRLSVRRPLVTTAVALVLTAGAQLYSVYNLTFITSAYRLLPQYERYVVLLREYLRDFGELNDIVVAIESDEPDRSKDFAAALLRELRHAGVTARITYRIDPAYFDQRGLLYLSVEELGTLRDRLLDREEFLDTYAARPTLARLLAALNQQIANAMLLSYFDIGLQDKRADDDLRFLESVLEQMSARLEGKNRYVSPWATAFSLGRFDDPDVGYFFSADRRLLFVFVQQGRAEGNFTDNRTLIEAIRGAVARAQAGHPGVRAGVTGAPTISNDEMVTALADSEVSALLAFGLTLALLLAAFRRVGKPVLMLTTLTVSLVWSIGIVTLVVGHLTIFSVMFVSIVVGFGIDYGIYILYRYEEERGLGAPGPQALDRTVERIGAAMLLATSTAAAAFFVLTLADFQGIKEFGFVAGTAILIAFLSMITLFPALLALVDGRRARQPSLDRGPVSHDRLEVRWLARLTGYRGAILAAATALTALSGWAATGVTFNYNMLELQAKGVDSVTWEERILATAGRSGFAAIATASSLDELRRKQAAFAALPSVSKVESALLALPDEQAEKIAIIRDLAPLIEPVRLTTPPALEPSALRPPLETLRRRLRLALEEATGDKTVRDLRRLETLVEGLLAKLDGADPRQVGPPLARLQDDVFRDFSDRLRSFKKSVNPRPVAADDLPPELKQRFVGTSGRFLIRVQPAVDIWHQAGAERFVHDLRSVDPDVTGPPITSFEAIRYIRRGYFDGTLYALLLVTAVTAFALRSLRGTVLALSPLMLGVLWTLGLMRVFGLEFNVANVWALPLIVGTAAEFGVAIFAQFLESREHGGPALARSTVMAVILNGLTTLAGFGSLMVAHHRGIFGLGLLLTIGSCAALVSSLVVLPVLINLFAAPRTDRTESRVPTAGGA